MKRRDASLDYNQTMYCVSLFVLTTYVFVFLYSSKILKEAEEETSGRR